MANVFLTNATGYIGKAVAQELKQKGYTVSALARTDQAAKQLQKEGIKEYRGDLKQPQTYEEALRKADIVIHTAFTNDAEAPQVDAQTVDFILKTLKGTNNTFIYTSGVWVLGETKNQPANETTPTNNAAPLVAWRPAVENKVLQAAKEGLRTVVLRPAVVYGREGGIIQQLLESAEKYGQVRYVGNGENRWTAIHVDDLAKLYVLAAEKAQPGSILHGTNNEQPLTQREIAEHVARAAGKPGQVQQWPVEEARKTLGGFADALTLDQHIESKQTQQQLGFKPTAPQLVEYLASVKTLAGAAKR